MPPNRTVALLIRLTALAATIPASAATAPAPAASPPTGSASAASTEEALVLSPFSVTASSDVGYAATSTLGGTCGIIFVNKYNTSLSISLEITDNMEIAAK